MTAILIVLAVLLLIFILLVLPLTVDLSYEKEFCYRIKYVGFVLFDSEKRIDINRVKRKKKRKKHTQKPSDKLTDQDDGFLKRTYKQKGFFGTVRYFSELLQMLLKRLWWVVKHLKFRHFVLDLTVATSDAANTALEYGAVCSAVYPVLSFLETESNFKNEGININADFDKKQPEFKISFCVTTRLLFWVVGTIAVIFDFIKLQRKESEKI